MNRIFCDYGSHKVEIAITFHALRRYRKRVKRMSKTLAKRKLKTALNSVNIPPISEEAPDNFSVRFCIGAIAEDQQEGGYIVLRKNMDQNYWIVVTILHDNWVVRKYPRGSRRKRK